MLCSQQHAWQGGSWPGDAATQFSAKNARQNPVCTAMNFIALHAELALQPMNEESGVKSTSALARPSDKAHS